MAVPDAAMRVFERLGIAKLTGRLCTRPHRFSTSLPSTFGETDPFSLTYSIT
jgi:hypothetical protein